MKHLCLVAVIILSLGLRTQAQQIELMTNGNFELWDSLDSYVNPKNWFTLNPLVDIGFEATTELTTDAHGGNYAVRLTSKEGQFTDLSGVLCTGPLLNQLLQPDFSKMKIAFTRRPAALRFYYKTLQPQPDTAAAAFVMTKWNANTQSSDTVAFASIEMTGNDTAYREAFINFTYYSALNPDSAYFIASSSMDGFNPTPGSTLFLDDLALIYYQTGVENLKVEMEPQMQVWPNPTNGVLHINSSVEIVKGRLYDYTGREFPIDIMPGKNQEIDFSQIREGLYILQLESATQSKQLRVIVK